MNSLIEEKIHKTPSSIGIKNIKLKREDMNFLKLFDKIFKNRKKEDQIPLELDLQTEAQNTGASEKESSKFERTKTEATQIISEEDTVTIKTKHNQESPASLLLLTGPKDLTGMSWPLTKMVTNVGRSTRLNDIIIPYKSLSKSHFQLIKENENFYIVDLKSTNKTYIDDQQIEPYKKIALENNSYIRTSSLVFKFLDKGNIETFSSKQILNKAQTDTLTGAGNRQLLKVKGPEYFLSNQELSLIVFDIDNFKSINDSLGHIAGDYVLKTLSKYVLDIIREGDLFVRYGGDEFCIFTPNSLSIASNIADRINQKLQKNDFIFEDKKISVNISVGLAEKSLSDKNWEDIYHRADKLFYQRKKRKKAFQAR